MYSWCDESSDDTDILTESLSSSEDSVLEIDRTDPTQYTNWPSEGARWDPIYLNYFLVSEVSKRINPIYHFRSVDFLEAHSDTSATYFEIKESFRQKLSYNQDFKMLYKKVS